MVPESWVEFVLSLHTTLISFISTITCANLLQLFSLLLSTLYVFPSYTTYFRCRLAPSTSSIFPEKDSWWFSHFYSTFIISSIYHQELIFELTFCARSQVSRSRLLLPRRSLFVYTELCWRKKEEFMSRLQSYRLCFFSKRFPLSLPLRSLLRVFFGWAKGTIYKYVGCVTFLYDIYESTCLHSYLFFLVFCSLFLILYSWTIIFRMYDAIFVVKSFSSDETRFWYGIKWRTHRAKEK